MSHKLQLATVLAIAISASGTISSVQAGGFGGFSGGSHSSHGHSSHHHSSGGFKVGGSSNSNSAPRILNNNNLGTKILPKNTGIAGGLPRVGGTNSGTGIKLPGVGTIGSSNNSNKGPILNNVLKNTTTVKNLGVIQSSNALKNVSDKFKSPSVQQKVLGGIGIGIGVGGSSHNHDHHDHHHHGHHHHYCPPLVFTLPVCQPNYCPPPCPPIYYPIPVAVPVPVADPNAVPVDPNAVPAAQVGLPMETKQALEDVVATDAKPADVQPAVATELVSKEVSLPQIPVGATLTLQGKDLTDKEGQVVLQFGEIALPATIKEWKNDSVTCTLPVLGLTKPSKAILHVLKADGKTASTLNCEIVTTLPTSVQANTATTSDIEAAKYEQ